MGRNRKYCSAQPYLDYIGVSEKERRMNKDYIMQGMSKIYFYACHKCEQGKKSRDEVFARDSRPGYPKARYICLKCLYEEKGK